MKTILVKLFNSLKIVFKNIINSIWNFIKSYPEVLSIPIGLIIWELVRFILKADPENAPIDNGVLQIIPFSIIQISVYVSITWMFLGIIFGTFREYIEHQMKLDFNELTKWQKIIISYGVFFALLYAIVILSTSLL